MSLLAMTAPSSPHTSFRRNCSWESDVRHSSEFAPVSRPRVDLEPVALPSIRQAFPELQLRVIDSPSNPSSRGPPGLSRPSSTTSNTGGGGLAVASSEYVHSPSSAYKRQRLVPNSDERDERFSQVPRLCTVPSHLERTERLDRSGSLQRGIGPGASPTTSPYIYAASAASSPPISSASSATAINSAMDGWPSSRPMASNSSGSSRLPPNYRDSMMDRVSERLMERQHSRYEHDPSPPVSHPRDYPGEPYPSSGSSSHRYQQHHQHHQHSGHHAPPPPPPPHLPPPSQSSGNAYGFAVYQHHPPRMQSLSMGDIRAYDRTGLNSSSSSSSNGMRYHRQQSAYHRDCVPVGDFSSLGLVGSSSAMMGGGGSLGDTKTRKRRGNLPKETTDKLRAWFVAHLHHPYPSEDEKQELMRQTGLQMNQISNWFINARRRQLPAMINSARVETDAMSSSHNGGSSSSMANGMGDGSHRHSSSHHSIHQNGHHRSHHGRHHSHHHPGSVLPLAEHRGPSPDRVLPSRPMPMYGGDREVNNGSPMSEDDYNESPRRHGHMKRGSV